MEVTDQSTDIPQEFFHGLESGKEVVVCPLPARNFLRRIGFHFPEDSRYQALYEQPYRFELMMAENPIIHLYPGTLMSDFMLWEPIMRMGDWDNPTFRAIRLEAESGYSQLGLIREVIPWPVINSRGWHVVSVAYASAATCAKIAIEQKEEFLETTEQYRTNTNDQRHIYQMIQLSAILALLHDFHPPGGDGIKRITGIDEVVMFDYIMSSPQYFEEFCSLCIRHGLDPYSVRDLAKEVIARKHSGFLGQLVHGPHKDKADLDWVMYTLGDLSLGLIFLTNTIYGDWERSPYLDTVLTFLLSLGVYLRNFEGQYSPGHNKLAFNFSWFNPFPQIKLVNGEIVYDCPEIMYALSMLSGKLHQHRYFDPNMMGPRLELKALFENNRELYPSDNDLKEMTLPELKRRFAQTPAAHIMTPKHHTDWIRYGPLGKAELKSLEEQYDDLIVEKLPFNLRLQTSVLFEGIVMTLEKWFQEIGLGQTLFVTGTDPFKIEARWQEGFIAFRRDIF